MCLSVPARVISIDGQNATVSVGGTIVPANLSLVDGIQTGDYILLHTGFVLQKIDENEAAGTLNIFKAMNYLAASGRGISEGFLFNFAPRGGEYDPLDPST